MSDLDDEELEATKKLQEKTDDEMFKSLGYRKVVVKEDFRDMVYK